MPKPCIIIAAIASCAYAKMARDAGFEVIAIDAFADVDTQNSCKQVHQITVQNGQFDAKQLLAVLDKIDLKNCIGFSYGAGFEAQPDLLAAISKRLPLIGNSPKTVTACKNPQIFFALCDALAMLYPATQFERPSDSINWLQKRIGGSGGAHIKSASATTHKAEVYYQQIQAGTPFSCLFLADENNSQVIGFNQQWCESTYENPYQYGGAVSHTKLSEMTKNKVTNFVQAAAKKLNLRGFNSCDFLFENEQIFMLEINPRLSASLDLYRAKNGHLFAAHVAACLGQLESLITVEKQARAHHIIYAKNALHVAPNIAWPDWARDIPQPNSRIAAGAPVCTVFARARAASQAKRLVLARQQLVATAFLIS